MSCAGIDLGHVLYTIRTLESGGDYHAQNPNSSASGAYQYVDGTWNHYKGFARAMDAPPSVQDEKAAADVNHILGGHSCDLRWVPAVWFAGPGGANGSWDQVPGSGNRMTIQQYVDKWMGIFTGTKGGNYTGGPGGSGVSTMSDTSQGGCMFELPIPGHPCLMTELAFQSITGMLLVGAGGVGILFCAAMIAKSVFGAKMAGTVATAIKALPVAGAVAAASSRKAAPAPPPAASPRVAVRRDGDRVKVSRNRPAPRAHPAPLPDRIDTRTMTPAEKRALSGRLKEEVA